MLLGLEQSSPVSYFLLLTLPTDDVRFLGSLPLAARERNHHPTVRRAVDTIMIVPIHIITFPWVTGQAQYATDRTTTTSRILDASLGVFQPL